ncbi:GMP synthase (glutamine-hydrolyzing) [secondary endosymbiont of Heteropsylla cubana]|uniref:GMP synthase [glutamine-hydrolyzing] n=1 Tax=secondary endosymbiont of Heteropsylla cubana TaxID=134287 RepID=J3TGE6_9ENTR|nr:glutamine-hydrolyzing GMP synthase [secondary endosymbiont of Heteropsylla cubana]AFP85492.1 GMP synthase (glutamine-hydrolyzing) [secondary endosymbiont of Heteropsylla cubana]
MTGKLPKDRILILDFGSQYTQLVARRIRELGVYCELWRWDVIETHILKFNPSGIILSGGPESTTRKDSPRAPDCVFQAGVPVLGICYGMQTMAIQLGGEVQVSTKREFGYAKVEVLQNSSLLLHDIQDEYSSDGMPVLDVWMSHGDNITSIPLGFINIAKTESCPFTVIENEEKRFYGVQFHPEVTHTRQGQRILERFVFHICECVSIWTPTNIIKNAMDSIQETIKNDHVILGLSGGVDSLVSAVLLQRAIGSRLICVFVDNGLLRLNEGRQIMDMFKSFFKLNIVYVLAEDQFLSALSGIKDPEKKRKTIGRVFVDVFNKQVLKFSNVKWLAQGTIYTDIIESAKTGIGASHVIKSYHNVGGLPKKMKLGLVEPLKSLFKDEVYKIGLALGLPYEILNRHPFPGSGLGVRILGEVKKEYCELLRYADAIFIEELHKANLYNKLSQAFAVFLPVRTVGIMGDTRKYEWVISLRAIQTIDFMTAHWACLPDKFLRQVSTRIINEINGVSRVVYDISNKPPATIEWE